MADLKKTIEIIFGGKNEISSTIGTIERDMRSLSGTLQDVSAPFAKITESVMKLDVALAGLALGTIYKAIDSSMKFNQSFGLINTAIQGSDEQIASYRQSILDYATTSTKSIADITSALYTEVQAGVKMEDSLKFLAAAEQLATANAAGLNTTVDLLTGTMNAYGMKIGDINKINDIYFTSTLIGKQTIDELGQSMGQVVGIAASSGVSLEELSAAIATLTAKGMGTEMAITGIKNVITGIVSPSGEAAKAAKALGLNFDITTIQSKGFANVLKEIMMATGGSEEKLVSMFNEIRAMNAIMLLTNDNMDFFNYALKETANSAGSAERAYQKMVQTLSNQMQMVKNIIEVTFISIGSKLEPIFAGIAQETGKIFQAITVAVQSGAFDSLFKYLEEIGRQLAEKLATIAKNLPEAMKGLDFTPIIEALKRFGGTLGKTFSDLFGNIDLSTPEGLRKVLHGIIEAIAKLIDFTSSIVQGMRPFIKLLGEIAEKAVDADDGIWDFVGTLTGALTVLNKVTPVLETTAFTIAAIANAPAAWTAITSLGSKLTGLIPMLEKLMSVAALAAMNPVILAILGISAVAYKGIDEGLNAYKNAVDATTKVQDESSKAFAAQTAAMIVQKYTAGELTAAQAELHLKNLMLATGFDTTSMKAGILAKEHERLASATKQASEESKQLTTSLDKIPAKKSVSIGVQADGSTIQETEGIIIKTFPDGRPMVITNVGVKTDDKSLKDTKDKLEKEIPKEKLLEIQANIDIARIKEQSQIVQANIEWKAKIDIAQIEAQTQRIKAMFESVNTAIESTGQVLSSMFGDYIEYLKGGSYSSKLESTFDAENRRRDEVFQLQRELINAEIDEIRTRSELMRSGREIGIKISADGLKPHLTAFMFEILNEIQVKATAEGVKMLVA